MANKDKPATNPAPSVADAPSEQEPKKVTETAAPQEDAGTQEPRTLERPTPKVEERQEPTTYPRSEHIELAMGMYGEPSHVVAGALTLVDSDADDLPKDVVEKAIKRFYNKKVEYDRPGEDS